MNCWFFVFVSGFFSFFLFVFFFSFVSNFLLFMSFGYFFFCFVFVMLCFLFVLGGEGSCELSFHIYILMTWNIDDKSCLKIFYLNQKWTLNEIACILVWRWHPGAFALRDTTARTVTCTAPGTRTDVWWTVSSTVKMVTLNNSVTMSSLIPTTFMDKIHSFTTCTEYFWNNSDFRKYLFNH